MRLPTTPETLESIARSRFAQAERLEREVGAVREEWGPARHEFMDRWLRGELPSDALCLFAAEHYHAVCALADAAAAAAILADGLLAEQLAAYAAGQERALSLWLRFAAATGWSGSAWCFGEDPLPETIACSTAWRSDDPGDALAGHLLTIWAVESALAPLAGAQCEALRHSYGFDHAATRYFARRARRGEHDAAVAQAGLTSLLPVTTPLALVCRAQLACRSYLELVDGVARQLSGA